MRHDGQQSASPILAYGAKMKIQPTSDLLAIQGIKAKPVGPETPSSGPNFSGVLNDMIENVNQEMLHADTALENYASGESNDLNAVVVSSVKADLSFRMLIEMRNRITDSYQELSRMQF